jgi:hypothetical protein
MKCPYCVENLKEGAKVCRYCSQEIGLLITEQTKVRDLEDTISDLERRLSEAEEQSRPIIEKLASTETRAWKIALVAFLASSVPVLAAGASVILDISLGDNIVPGTFVELGYLLITAVLTFVVWFLPLPLGFWVALLWPESHQSEYIGIGILVGALQLLLAALLYEGLARLDSQFEWKRFVWSWQDQNLQVFFVAWFVITALLFISGAFLGDVAKLKALKPDKWMSGWAENLAKRISRRTKRLSGGQLVTLIRWSFASSPAIIAALISLSAALVNIANSLIKVVP